MNRRKFIGTGLAIVVTPSTIFLSGCGQTPQTISQIAGDVGTAVAAVATAEGNSVVASQVIVLSNAVQTAIADYVSGQTTTNVINAVSALLTYLNGLSFATPTDKALLLIAVQFTNQLLAAFGVTTTPIVVSSMSKPSTVISANTIPTNAQLKALHSQFKSAWNNTAASDPTRASIKIK